MIKPWTVRLVSMRSGVTVAYAEDLPRFWTHRGAMKRCRHANRTTRLATAIWLPVLTRRTPW